MAFNLTESIKNSLSNFAKTGVLLADSTLVEYRIDQCVGCPHFQAENSRCLKCGCYMNMKTRLVASKCPVGKW